jgi:hypothetical protein
VTVGSEPLKVIQVGLLGYRCFFLDAHLAFIIVDSFFLMAGDIGLRLDTVFFAAAFFGAAPPFC